MVVKGFSVIICCYNGESRIAETLSYAFKLRTDGLFAIEIILINNNSTDATVNVAKLANDNYNQSQIAFRIIDEPQPGLTAARMRGLAESKYDLILFCDDDNHLDANYLLVARALFLTIPNLGIAGGWNRPAFSSPQPNWLEDFYCSLAIEKSPRPKGTVSWVFGAGMIVTKAVFETIHQRQIKLFLTDRSGSKQTSGGDIELCLLASWLGYNVYYSPELILSHKVAEDRLQARNILRLNTDNFLPTVHLFLLERIINEKDIEYCNSMSKFLFKRIWRAVRAFPRLIMGRKKMLNLLELYGNIMVVGCVLMNFSKIRFSFKAIKDNLYKN
jgi:glycosyltransferase involved in cell wall biosynthesis